MVSRHPRRHGRRLHIRTFSREPAQTCLLHCLPRLMSHLLGRRILRALPIYRFRMAARRGLIGLWNARQRLTGFANNHRVSVRVDLPICCLNGPLSLKRLLRLLAVPLPHQGIIPVSLLLLLLTVLTLQTLTIQFRFQTSHHQSISPRLNLGRAR